MKQTKFQSIKLVLKSICEGILIKSLSWLEKKIFKVKKYQNYVQIFKLIKVSVLRKNRKAFQSNNLICFIHALTLTLVSTQDNLRDRVVGLCLLWVCISKLSPPASNSIFSGQNHKHCGAAGGTS